MFNYLLYRWCKRVDNESEISLSAMQLFDFDTQQPWHKSCDGQGGQDTGDAATDDGVLGVKSPATRPDSNWPSIGP